MLSRPEPVPDPLRRERSVRRRLRRGKRGSEGAAPVRHWQRASSAPGEPVADSERLQALLAAVAAARTECFALEKGFKSLVGNLTEAERDAYYEAHPEWSAAAARYRELVLAADVEYLGCVRKNSSHVD